jgi:hypothetical protein
VTEKTKVRQDFFCSQCSSYVEHERFFIREDALDVWKSYQDQGWIEYKILETRLRGYSISFTLTELGRSLIDLSKL